MTVGGSEQRSKRQQLTCVFVALQSVQRLRLVQGENADVIVVSTCCDKSSGVFFTRCDYTNTGDKVGVSGHAVHLCEASVGTEEQTQENSDQ